MTPETVLAIFQQTLEMIILLVAIILLPALVIGLMISVFQAATQINEMTLSFIPKLVTTLLTLMIAGPYMLQLIIDYTKGLIMRIPGVID